MSESARKQSNEVGQEPSKRVAQEPTPLRGSKKTKRSSKIVCNFKPLPASPKALKPLTGQMELFPAAREEENGIKQ